jgi:hypothetical protein
MATLQREKVYEEILIRDQWKVTKACCEKLEAVQAGWNFCPFCGEKVTYADTVVDTVPNVGKAGG